MDPTNSEPDVLGKIDALLTRHRTGAPTRQDLASAEAQAARRAAIPILTEIITEDSAIPVLTEAIPVIKVSETADPRKPQFHAEAVGSQPGSTGTPVTDISHDEETLHQLEDFIVQDMENRIALEFAATLDRVLNELLDHTREHIRHAVRETLKQRLETPPHGAQGDPDQP